MLPDPFEGLDEFVERLETRIVFDTAASALPLLEKLKQLAAAAGVSLVLLPQKPFTSSETDFSAVRNLVDDGKRQLFVLVCAKGVTYPTMSKYYWMLEPNFVGPRRGVLIFREKGCDFVADTHFWSRVYYQRST